MDLLTLPSLITLVLIGPGDKNTIDIQKHCKVWLRKLVGAFGYILSWTNRSLYRQWYSSENRVFQICSLCIIGENIKELILILYHMPCLSKWFYTVTNCYLFSLCNWVFLSGKGQRTPQFWLPTSSCSCCHI